MSDPQKALVESINDKLHTGKLSRARLETDDRILARITDGIYRQPASALRELIANAYDADATHVYIQTDAPRFRTISVRDDGNGLTIESLANLIYHIGGSPKRTRDGVALGVVNKADATLSPRGRRLIGKIGIGLFSVAQLTRKFQIITKTAGTDYRLVSEVVLKTYTEDDLASLSVGQKTKVETGAVTIKSVPATDKDVHGTEIILLDIRPQTRDLLQSRDEWLRVEAAVDPEMAQRSAPSYHIARLQPGKDDVVKTRERLPWVKADLPEDRFAKLFQAVVEEVGESSANPTLEVVLDNYLRMLWTLSLSAPIDYIETHPFDLTQTGELDAYRLSNDSKGQTAALKLKKGQSIRDVMDLKAPERGNMLPFSVYVDDIQLKRPIRFRNLPRTSHIITHPLIFIGKAAPDLSTINEDERGGNLSFEAYFFWTPKVVPKEHNGLLVRISDASGTLFDETFMKYQIAELTRLRQITAEIFVRQGLDAALNIDRESFNYAHPHYQYLMKWVHRALRQLTNLHKQLSSGRRGERAERERKERARQLEKTVRRKLKRVLDDEDDIPDVVFADDKTELRDARKGGALAFESAVVFADLPDAQRQTAAAKGRQNHFAARMAAVARILDAYGVFDKMPYAKQQELLQAIVAVFAEKEEE